MLAHSFPNSPPSGDEGTFLSEADVHGQERFRTHAAAADAFTGPNGEPRCGCVSGVTATCGRLRAYECVQTRPGVSFPASADTGVCVCSVRLRPRWR